jgi:uncharacterized protein YcgI (DUF1989 family)
MACPDCDSYANQYMAIPFDVEVTSGTQSGGMNPDENPMFPELNGA